MAIPYFFSGKWTGCIFYTWVSTRSKCICSTEPNGSLANAVFSSECTSSYWHVCKYWPIHMGCVIEISWTVENTSCFENTCLDEKIHSFGEKIIESFMSVRLYAVLLFLTELPGWYLGLQVTGMIKWRQKIKSFQRTPWKNSWTKKTLTPRKSQPKRIHCNYATPLWNNHKTYLFAELHSWGTSYHKSSNNILWLWIHQTIPTLIKPPHKKILVKFSCPRKSQKQKLNPPKKIISATDLRSRVPPGTEVSC